MLNFDPTSASSPWKPTAAPSPQSSWRCFNSAAASSPWKWLESLFLKLFDEHNQLGVPVITRRNVFVVRLVAQFVRVPGQQLANTAQHNRPLFDLISIGRNKRHNIRLGQPPSQKTGVVDFWKLRLPLAVFIIFGLVATTCASCWFSLSTCWYLLSSC